MLTVMLQTDRTAPSVYKLKSSKQDDESLPNSVCLVTDFPDPQKILKVDGMDSSLNSTAVLDKSTNDVWRYSTVVWNDKEKDNCIAEYDNSIITPESDLESPKESCTSLDENFRTNPTLNASSLTVLGLRVLTFKAFIFNLIMTLRLWSS